MSDDYTKQADELAALLGAGYPFRRAVEIVARRWRRRKAARK